MSLPFSSSDIDLDSISDVFTCQGPIIHRPDLGPSIQDPEEPQPSGSESPNLLTALKTLWHQLEDPSDPRIISILEEISSITGDIRNELVHRYKTLIIVSGDDFLTIIDEITRGTDLGIDSLIHFFRVALTAYSSAKARTSNIAVKEIVTVATDLNMIACETMSQYDSYKESLHHLTLSWNSVAASMSAYMAQIDQKLLQTATPSRSVRFPAPSPSLDSRGSPDPISGNYLTLTPGTIYQSSMGALTYISDTDVTFLAESEEGIPLGKLIGKVKSPKILQSLLNKDLRILCRKLKESEQKLDEYETLSKEAKFAYLKELVRSAPNLTNQWASSAR